MLTIPQLSCFDNFKMSMLKYCKFDGRARRSEFWFFQLMLFFINSLYSLIASIILTIVKKKEEGDKEINIYENKVVVIIWAVIDCIFVLPSIGVSVRRLHDIGRSGYYYFLYFLKLFHFHYLFFVYFD